MKLNPIDWFRKSTFDIEFKDVVGTAVSDFPIRLAKREPLAFTKAQKEHVGKLKFHQCPGMIDYAQMGYIMPAWETIKFKANRAGSTAFYYNRHPGAASNQRPSKMAPEIVDHVFSIEDDVPLQPWKCDSPWRVYCDKDISALVLPAFYHAKFLDDIFVYPGVVDYKGFQALNFIFAAKRECEVTINAGDPLLQIIPFQNKDITCGYGLATMEQLAKEQSSLTYAVNRFYNKVRTYKKYDLNKPASCPVKHD